MSIPSLKIVVIGDASVGKTSLINRWQSGKFVTNINPTIGTKYSEKKMIIEGKEVKIVLWDTAGQEQYNSLIPMYVRDAAAAIIVCSMDDIDSFSNIQKWIDFVNMGNVEQVPFILFINKVDKRNEEDEYTIHNIERQWKETFKGIFYVSAKTGENLDNSFMYVSGIAYENSRNSLVSTLNENKSKSCC